MAFNPVSDAEWQYLRRRFRGLWGGRSNERGSIVIRSGDEIRELFDQGLPGSDVDDGERRRARTIVRERVREHSVEAFPDPYFELEWERAVAANPELGVYPGSNTARRMLWEAYYERDETDARRKKARSDWKKISGQPARTDDQVWEDT